MDSFKYAALLVLVPTLGCIRISSASFATYTGDGHITSETRSLASFQDVELGGAYDVTLIQGDSSSVQIETDQNLLSHITTQVSNGKLEVNSEGNIGPTKGIRVVITSPKYHSVELDGSGDVRSAAPITSDALKLNLAGSGNYYVAVQTKQFETSVEGSGTVNLTGNAEKHSVTIEGAGDVKADGLTSNDATVEIMGSGDASLTVNHRLDASIEGSGNVRYHGAATEVHPSIAGSGSVERVN